MWRNPARFLFKDSLGRLEKCIVAALFALLHCTSNGGVGAYAKKLVDLLRLRAAATSAIPRRLRDAVRAGLRFAVPGLM